VLGDLETGSPKKIRDAAKQLGDIDLGGFADAALADDGKVISRLRGMAENADRPVAQKAAARGLDKLGPEFVGRLTKNLGDVGSADKILGAIGGMGSFGAGVAPKLAELLTDSKLDSGVRSAAADALGDIGARGDGDSVAKALEKAAGGGDKDVADSARKALGKLR
jgi:hypothetical protein